MDARRHEAVRRSAQQATARSPRPDQMVLRRWMLWHLLGLQPIAPAQQEPSHDRRRHCSTRRAAQLRDRLRALAGSTANVAARISRLRSHACRRWASIAMTRPELQDVDAVLLASARGTEALIAARLDDDQRLVAYARHRRPAARRRNARADRCEDGVLRRSVRASRGSEREEERMVRVARAARSSTAASTRRRARSTKTCRS